MGVYREMREPQMDDNFLPRNKNLRPLAAKLRAEMTKEERKLWYDCLSFYPVRFYRQRIIASYIVDFYCHKAKLVVELDGSQHYEEAGQQRDLRRTEYLESLGLKVIRFSNLDVLYNFDGVCTVIDLTVWERLGLDLP